MSNLGTQLRNAWSAVRSSYWFVPSIMLLASVLLSFLMHFFDATVDPQRLEKLPWIYINQPDGARALLSTVAGSMITVAGVTFSVTIVALSLASSQYGPRVLRNFMSDTGNQLVLGTFVATFMYCLLILRTVQGGDESTFVPHLSIVLAVVLAAVSLGVLIYFVHHTAGRIQIENLLASVARDLGQATIKMFPAGLGQDLAEEKVNLPEDFEEQAVHVSNKTDGYVQDIDKRLFNLAVRHDLFIYLECRPGDFVVQGKTLLRAWPKKRLDKALLAKMESLLIIGSHRSQAQDLAFLFDQLVEVALLALSPGVNEPYTAVMCIDRIEAGLCMLAKREVPSAYRCDDKARLRMVAFPLSLTEAVVMTLAAIRRDASNNLMVTLRLLRAVETVGDFTANEKHRQVLLEEASNILVSAQASLSVAGDREAVERAYHRTLRALDPQGQRDKEDSL
jgi:uncharacterized membrane protein